MLNYILYIGTSKKQNNTMNYMYLIIRKYNGNLYLSGRRGLEYIVHVRHLGAQNYTRTVILTIIGNGQ